MNPSRRVAVALFALLSAAFFVPVPIAAEDGGGYGIISGFSEGRWRTEMGVSTGFHSGRRDRSGDVVVKGSIEYEWPVFERCALGLRAYPLFLYKQNDPSETLWGGGVGAVGRVYQVAGERRGWYGEGGAAVLGHTNHIEGNSGSINFMLEAGVGYHFRNDWHVALQVMHISNGGTSDDNAGANSVGLAVGFTF